MPTATTSQLELGGALASRVGRLARLLIRATSPVSRTQLSVLASLREGPKRITELAAGEHVAQPTMTVLVDRLEKQGWAERRPNAADRRAVDVTITEAGNAMLAELSEARAAVVACALAELTAEEQDALVAALPALDRLTEVLR